MKRQRSMALAVLSGAAALALAACGGSSNGSNSSGSGASGPASFNAAITKVVNPSTHKGGTLSFGLSSTPDSTDPGNTYYAFMWNFARLYTMPLMTYKSCPGKCGLQVVPDLATGPGVVSDNGLTWTYHIQAGRQVRGRHHGHLVRREVRGRAHLRPGRFPLGPSYYPELLAAEARLSRPVHGPVQEHHGPEGGADAEPDDDRVPPGEAVCRLQLRGRDPAECPGATQ